MEHAMHTPFGQRIGTLAASVALSVGAIAGCSSGGGDATGGTSSAGASAKGAPAVTSGTVTFVSNGGALQKAQKTAFLDPFSKANPGIKVLEDTGSTDYAKLVAQVDAGAVKWDLVDVGGDFAVGEEDKYLTAFDCSKVECPAGETTTYRLPLHTYASVLGYNKTKVSTPPASWADFFDTKRYPGKRSVFKFMGPVGLVEMALLADGVPIDKLTPLDVDRALKKLDTIKPDIIWAASPTDAARAVADGEAAMGNIFASQGYALRDSSPDLQMVWNGAGLGYDYLVIPKGSKNVAAATVLAAYMTGAEHNAQLPNIYPVGPGNPKAVPDKSSATYPFLPTSHPNDPQYVFDAATYSKNRVAWTEKYTAWLQK